jgi:hypothetical protein
MEMAITTMLIIYALCTMLLIIAEMTAILNKRTVNTATTRATVDSIGETFYQVRRNNGTFNVDAIVYQHDGQYTPVVTDLSEDTQRLLVYAEGNSIPVLCVDVTGTGADAKIVRWRHSAP